MPCYVIAHKRFRDRAQVKRFRARLSELAGRKKLRVHALSEKNDDTGEHSVLLEFDDAVSAQSFMCSKDYKALEQENEAARA